MKHKTNRQLRGACNVPVHTAAEVCQVLRQGLLLAFAVKLRKALPQSWVNLPAPGHGLLKGGWWLWYGAAQALQPRCCCCHKVATR